MSPLLPGGPRAALADVAAALGQCRELTGRLTGELCLSLAKCFEAVLCSCQAVHWAWPFRALWGFPQM